MKKIVFLHPAHWEQAMGGAELQISYLVKYIKGLGLDVHYIYEDKGYFIENKDGIELHPLKKIKIRKTFGERWAFYRYRIIKILNEIKPDIIYTRFYSSWSGIAAQFAKKNGIMHIWAIASDNDVVQRKLIHLAIKPLNIIEYYYVNFAFKNATHILTQNLFQRNGVEAISKRKSIHVSKVCNHHGNGQIKKPNNVIKFVWIANLKPLKHPEIFINLAHTLKTYNNCRFLMIGRMNPSYQSMVNSAQQALDNLHYMGELSIEEVHNILKESHVLVNTSDYEALPNTFIEAWMNKVVTLSMNVNPDEIITSQKIGFICPTIEVLIEKAIILINNKQLLNKMGEQSYEYVILNHSFEDYLIKIKDLMEL